VQLQDYQSQIRELVHDIAKVDWTDTELTTFVNNARKRVALDAHCVRTFVAGLNLIQSVEQYPFSGVVAGYTLTSPGTNYTAPLVTVGVSQGGGITATAAAAVTVSPGPIASITPTAWGSLYTAAPSVTIADSGGGTGSGATATPIMLLGTLDIISATVIWPGSLMARVLKWYPFSEFQAWVRSYRGSVTYPWCYTLIQEQGTLFIGRPPSQSYGLELDLVTLPTQQLVNATDVDLQIIDPWADAVQWWGAYLAMVKLQNYQHAGYFERAYEKRLKQVLATKQTRRVRDIYLSTFRRQMRGG